MIKVDGHIINEAALVDGGWVLDIGCRGMTLYSELGKSYRYICLDPDPALSYNLPNAIFLNYALSPQEGRSKYCGWSDGSGNHLYVGNKPVHATVDVEVDCITIDKLMQFYKVDQFELIKLDCEGSEYDLLLGIDSSVAKQIAVEFHQCVGHNKYGSHQQYIDKLMTSPFGNHYKIADFYRYPDFEMWD